MGTVGRIKVKQFLINSLREHLDRLDEIKLEARKLSEEKSRIWADVDVIEKKLKELDKDDDGLQGIN